MALRCTLEEEIVRRVDRPGIVERVEVIGERVDVDRLGRPCRPRPEETERAVAAAHVLGLAAPSSTTSNAVGVR